MSGSKRTPIDRRRSRRIDRETVARFKELELTPPRRRNTDTFKEQDYALHGQLGLGYERLCAQISVLDRRPHYYRPGGAHYENAERVRTTRLRLLTLAGMGGPGQKRAS
jgi:hypothetical protein